MRCQSDVSYFVNGFVMILNATNEMWEPFTLWKGQRGVLLDMIEHRRLVVLKARQLGLTWLCLAFSLWRMIFWPIATVGIFSRREDDAQELLDIRLKGMYDRLPDFMKTGRVVEDNKSRWVMGNGSTAMAFPTNGGRQHTFSLAMVDEADYQPDLPGLLSAVTPTVDAGGRMWLISSSNKNDPASRFKSIYRVAKNPSLLEDDANGDLAGDDLDDETEAASHDWWPVFLAWHERPERTQAWYRRQCRKSMAETGALDDVHGEYPATDTEALSARTLDKRIAAAWLEACYLEMTPLRAVLGMPSIPGLEIYRPPLPGVQYVIGGDPAEGQKGSDDSALTVVDLLTGCEHAVLSARIEPPVFGDYVRQVSEFYNDASAMIERNNHGHTVLLWLRDNPYSGRLKCVPRLRGHDGKIGWMTSTLGKALLYTGVAEHFRTNANLDGAEGPTVVLHSFATQQQLASIEKSTLAAPLTQHDDRADSYALAQAGRVVMMSEPPSNQVPASSGKRIYK